MKTMSIAAAAAFALISAGAAQAAVTAPLPVSTQSPGMASWSKYGAEVDPDAMKSLNAHSVRQQLTDNLTKAGFTSIKITPSSFYVQAKDKKGDPVAMVIGPDSFTAVTEMSGKTAEAAAPQPAPTPAQK